MATPFRILDISKPEPPKDMIKRDFVKNRMTPLLMRLISATAASPLTGKTPLFEEYDSIRQDFADAEKSAKDIGLLPADSVFFPLLLSCAQHPFKRDESQPKYKDVSWKNRTQQLRTSLTGSLFQLQDALAADNIFFSTDFYEKLYNLTSGDIVASIRYQYYSHEDVAFVVYPFMKDSFLWDAGGFYSSTTDKVIINGRTLVSENGIKDPEAKLQEVLSGLNSGALRLASALYDLGTSLQKLIIHDKEEEHRMSFQDAEANKIPADSRILEGIVIHEARHRIDRGATGGIVKTVFGAQIDPSSVVADSAVLEATAMLSSIAHGPAPRYEWAKMLALMSNTASIHARGARMIVPSLIECGRKNGDIKNAGLESMVGQSATLGDDKIRAMAKNALDIAYRKVEIESIDDRKPSG